MALNGVKAVILRYFTELSSWGGGNYDKMECKCKP